MNRLVVLAVAVLATCACRSQSPPGHDPFFGRTTVPPPPTGSAAVRPIDPYYRGASSGPAAAIPRAPSYGDLSVPPSAPRSSPANEGWVAAGSVGTETTSPATRLAGSPAAPLAAPTAAAMPAERSDWPGLLAAGPPSTPIRIVEPPPSARVEPARTTPPASATAASAQSPPPRTASSLEGRTPVVRVLEPLAAAPASPGALGASPGRLGAAPASDRAMPRPTTSIDIMDLPPAGSRTGAVGSGDGVRLATVTDPLQDGSAVVAAVGSDGTGNLAAASPYAFDPEYRWLRGRLEYSPLDRRWRLRYIPSDGEPDAFGGSLVLPDTSLLAGCQRGDFIEVRGRVDHRGTDGAPVPSYVVAELRRLGAAAYN